MTGVISDSLVVFALGEQAFALPVGVVEGVVQAVEVAPLPDAPRGVLGVINLRGRVVPVLDLPARLGQAARTVRASDHFIIARTPWRTVALLVDSVSGVVRHGAAPVTPVAEILPDMASISGVLRLNDELVLVQDLEQFISIEDHEKLQRALAPEP